MKIAFWVAQATGLCRPATRRTEWAGHRQQMGTAEYMGQPGSFRSAGRRPERASRPCYRFSKHALKPPRVVSHGRSGIAGCAITVLLVGFLSPLLASERFTVSLPTWAGSLSFSPDSKQLAVGCADSCVHILETEAGKESLALRGHEDYVASVAFSPDGKTVATGSYDHTARVWDTKSKRPRHTLRGHRGAVMSVAFSPDGKWLATASIDATVKLWNTKTGELRTSLSGHKSWVNSVVFSADGLWLVSGSSDGTIKLWRERTAELEATLNATDAEVRSVAISPDGKTVAAGIRYGTLQTWNFTTRREQSSIKAHESDVWSLAFSPDSRILISGDGDWNKPGVVKLWNAATLELRQTPTTSGEVLSVACSSDRRIIAAACGDGTVKAWTVPDERGN